MNVVCLVVAGDFGVDHTLMVVVGVDKMQRLLSRCLAVLGNDAPRGRSKSLRVLEFVTIS